MFVVLIKIFFAIFSLFSTYARGAQFYNYASQLCCDGTVHDMPAGASYDYIDCCGTDIIIYSDESENGPLCCEKKLHKRVNSTAECCGTKVYEPSTQACLELEEEFEVVPLSKDNLKEGKTEVCGKSKEFYDPEEQECCSGVLYDWKEDMECCGDKYMDTTVSECCIDYVTDEETKREKAVETVVNYDDARPNIPKCCKGVLIDAEKQECCGGVVLDFPENFTRNFIDDSSNAAFKDYSSYDYSYRPECCGTHLRTNEETQYCANNERLEYRDDRNQIRCGDGQLRNISGDKPLNVYCVDDKLELLTANEWKCSVNGEKITYDYTQRDCTEDGLVDFPVDKESGRQLSFCWKWKETYAKCVAPDVAYMPSSYDLNALYTDYDYKATDDIATDDININNNNY